MQTFNRGGVGLPLSGLFLTLVGVVLTVIQVRTGNSEASGMAASACCFLFGPAMMLFFAKVQIDPNAKLVKLSSGLRLAPRHKNHKWDEFDAVIAFEPSGMKASDASYAVYLRDGKSQEHKILIQQYNNLEKMQTTAKAISEMMALPALRVYRDEETPL